MGSGKWEVACGRKRLEWKVVRLGNLVKEIYVIKCLDSDLSFDRSRKEDSSGKHLR